MKTNLYAKSNAVLRTSEGEIIAIIECGKGKNISNKLEQSIREHFDAESVTINSSDILSNYEPVKFCSEIVIDGEQTIRDFEIQVVATY